MKEFLDQPKNENEKQLEILEKILGKDVFKLKLEQAREKRENLIVFFEVFFQAVSEAINPLGLSLENLKTQLENEITDLKAGNLSEELQKKEWELEFVKGRIESQEQEKNRKPPLTYEDFENADKKPEE